MEIVPLFLCFLMGIPLFVVSNIPNFEHNFESLFCVAIFSTRDTFLMTSGISGITIVGSISLIFYFSAILRDCASCGRLYFTQE